MQITLEEIKMIFLKKKEMLMVMGMAEDEAIVAVYSAMNSTIELLNR